MKLHRLELTGFGPFRDRQLVDFDAFDDDGLFLISGRTGTGKSSILDGVSFALYGTVPRYEGGEKRLRSDHSHLTDPTEVRLEFTVGDRRWRVTRAPEYDRPAKRGGGLTTEPARAELDEFVDGVWVGRAAKPRTVGEALGEVLGLNAAQFQQVILLAQNKFSRFLLAPGDERQTLLRTLFGTRRFEQYRDQLEQQRRDVQSSWEAKTERVRTLLGEAERLAEDHVFGAASEPTLTAVGDGGEVPLDVRREALASAAQRAEYRIEQTELARTRADADAAASAAAQSVLLAAAERARERAALSARLSALEDRSAEVADAARLLGRARAAATLRAPLDAHERAAQAHARADEAATVALRQWVDAGGDPQADLPVHIEALTGDIARAEDALDRERELAVSEAEHEAATRTIAELEAALVVADAQRATVPAERAGIDADLARVDPRAARRGELQVEHDRLVRVLDAARVVTARAEELSLFESRYAEAVAAAASATATVGALLRRRMAGYAGELAAALVPGEACAVCGSTTHPQPARPSDDPVTDDVLTAAESLRDEASAAEVAARQAAVAARETLALARVDAAGMDTATAEQHLARVAGDLSEAVAAVHELDELRARRTALDDAAASAEVERVALSERLAATRERHRAAAADVARLTVAVAAARGDFDTVAARVAASVAERDRARALMAAIALRDEQERARAAARGELDTLLTASPFDDAAEARDAVRSAAEIDALEAAVADHAAQLTATRARLLDLELDAVGDDVDDERLAAAAAAVAETDAARSAAIAAHSDARAMKARLIELLERIDEAIESVRDSADEVAAIRRLADTVAGRAPNAMKMDLETFVLAAELEEIVAAANLRLAEMSSGRYSLHHSDARAARGRASGLGIEVLDSHTGRLRSPQSLSGGETFLASLALALGLGEVVTSRAGGIRLDTLFVDEGFGSLDPETLELAMRTLDDLRAGGRTVGVISHVEAMKEQLPAQILVVSTSEGPSIIRQDAARPFVDRKVR
ncbi:SMC family ATPase [Microbacterium sp. VKM Ac-2870]|uniref:AAA family ATPase n=1 Tax=Microbacterium sp. VKM Ac-2870 TaxID=2783825 RepID=UPI00188A99C3|nr:SMC family ATPase [Microbacterium sp. VKM Ac-2870]MBF4562025.1 SMC family ATPase [Microbacterium sp. VKM Ac-2870]